MVFNGHNTINNTKENNKRHNIFYILIVDDYSKIPKLYGMEKISKEQVMNNMDMFQSIFGKIDEFGWWDLKRIAAYAESKFTLK